MQVRPSLVPPESVPSHLSLRHLDHVPVFAILKPEIRQAPLVNSVVEANNLDLVLLSGPEEFFPQRTSKA